MLRGNALVWGAALLFSGLFWRPAPTTGLGVPAQDAPTAPTAAAHPVLVELFTSEGCSSCPPADILLQKLDTSQPVAGAQLIVLSEHVTYWDQDGWKDPNSSEALTDRQSSYERALGVDGPYTPQFIVDGTRQASLGNLRQFEEALQNAKTAPKIAIRIGEVTRLAGNPDTLQAHVEADTNSAQHNAEVFVALALDHVESQVLRGENGGKHLVHVAVVQQLQKVGKLPKGKTFAQDIQLKLKPGEDPKNLRVVAFVQESGLGKILGAALRKPTS